jgi:hypothetical protein
MLVVLFVTAKFVTFLAPDAGVRVKFATGATHAAAALTVREVEFDPAALVTVSVMLKTPVVAYVWAGGDWTVEVPPSPNVHAQLVGVPVEDSVTVTARGAAPVLGVTEKAATGATGPGGVGVGAGAAATVTVWVVTLVPLEFETVWVIV